MVTLLNEWQEVCFKMWEGSCNTDFVGMYDDRNSRLTAPDGWPAFANSKGEPEWSTAQTEGMRRIVSVVVDCCESCVSNGAQNSCNGSFCTGERGIDIGGDGMKGCDNERDGQLTTCKQYSLEGFGRYHGCTPCHSER